ncbi:MAG: ammonium transporter [Dehalococcoidia bacterium]|nr:ammonium transporter [Dehalococcoidia bacterium]
MNAGDTAWVLASAALVLLMTPALAFFYGGLVGRKNVLSTIMHSFVIICIISVQWVLWGYTLAFGPDMGGMGIIGGLDWFGLNGVGGGPSVYAATIPHEAFMIFQAMFAVITPALISGAFAERMKFKTFLVFTVLWATLVYDPVAHWVWALGPDGAAGWVGKLGAIDFAGGTVVHINAGLAALAAAMIIKPRLGYGKEPKEPHNIPFVVLGAGLLWFGWFGFNAGSALAGNALAANAFVVTNTATAAAGLAWMTMAWMMGGSPGVVGIASGAVAGLVAITPASGYVTPMASVIIGLGAGAFCYLAARIRAGWKSVDDALDVFAVHGVGGIWGALATGLFATVAINAAGKDGLFYGNPSQFVNQLIAVAVTAVYSFVVTYILLWVLDKTMGLRVKTEEEEVGLDITQHGEKAYVE